MTVVTGTGETLDGAAADLGKEATHGHWTCSRGGHDGNEQLVDLVSAARGGARV